jgi:hypothetical protein
MRLSRVGGGVFVVILVLGVVGAVADLMVDSVHGDQTAAVLLVLMWLVLAVVWAADNAFQLLWSALRHLARA